MPIATPEVYAEMLGRAKEHSFAFPAINCVGSESINAAIKGFADAGSDDILAQLPEAGRVVDVRACHRGLQRPTQHRPQRLRRLIPDSVSW